MAGVTKAQAEAQLSAWLAASLAVASNQSYSIGNRSLTRADAEDITKQIDYWQGYVNRLSSQGSRKRTRFMVK